MTSPPVARGPTHVVTCFLLRHEDGDERIFLVRRSEHVRTYRGAWAGVSGYLEAGVEPLAQAYTELWEETSLDRAAVRLLASGEPLAVANAAAGLSWVVHPFLFAILAPDRMRTDWEATATMWVAPDAVTQLATVPRLAETLARVYPPPGAPDGSG